MDEKQLKRVLAAYQHCEHLKIYLHHLELPSKIDFKGSLNNWAVRDLEIHLDNWNYNNISELQVLENLAASLGAVLEVRSKLEMVLTNAEIPRPQQMAIFYEHGLVTFESEELHMQFE